MMPNLMTVPARDLHDLLVPFRILSQCCLSLKHPVGFDPDKFEKKLAAAYDHALNVLRQNLLTAGHQPSSCRWSQALKNSQELLEAIYPDAEWPLVKHKNPIILDPLIAMPEAVLRRILVNLFDNAAKAQEVRHDICHLESSLAREGNQPYLFVKISNSIEASALETSGGFGLGLEIISDLLARYCGSLHFQAVAGSFLVELHLPIADDQSGW